MQHSSASPAHPPPPPRPLAFCSAPTASAQCGTRGTAAPRPSLAAAGSSTPSHKCSGSFPVSTLAEYARHSALAVTGYLAQGLKYGQPHPTQGQLTLPCAQRPFHGPLSPTPRPLGARHENERAQHRNSLQMQQTEVP